jgi:hypothetical protein
MYGSIIGFWDKFHPIIEGLRTRFSMPYAFKDVEGLYDEMKRVRDRRGDPLFIHTTPQP